jgi:hypothetical protein
VGYFHNIAVVSGQAHHSQIKMQSEYTNPSTAEGLTVTDVMRPAAFHFCPFCRSGQSASSDVAKEPYFRTNSHRTLLRYDMIASDIRF